MAPNTLRVLVVDDERYIRELFAELLVKQGCLVETAGNGTEALTKLRKAEYDVMLSDIRMPHMDGFTLLKAVEKTYPRMAVVMMTGFSQDFTIKEAISLGAEGYLPKPFRLEEVLLVLQQACEKAASRYPDGEDPADLMKEETEAA